MVVVVVMKMMMMIAESTSMMFKGTEGPNRKVGYYMT